MNALNQTMHDIFLRSAWRHKSQALEKTLSRECPFWEARVHHISVLLLCQSKVLSNRPSNQKEILPWVAFDEIISSSRLCLHAFAAAVVQSEVLRATGINTFLLISVLCICALAEAVAQSELLRQSTEGLGGQTTTSGKEEARCLERGSVSNKR